MWLDLYLRPQEMGRDELAHMQYLLWCDKTAQLVCLSLLYVTCIFFKYNWARVKLVVFKIPKENNDESIQSCGLYSMDVLLDCFLPLPLDECVYIEGLVLFYCICVNKKPSDLWLNETTNRGFALTFKALLADNQVLRQVSVAGKGNCSSNLHLGRI